MSEGNLVRINKFLSEIGYCSRRAADTLVEEGRVKVNGVVAVMGAKITPDDVVMVDDKLVTRPKEDFVYIAFNKPVGVVCTTDIDNEKDNIIDYINHPQRIFPIGRLDKLSEGLILLTSDGDIVNKILRSKNNHEKEYIVTVDKELTSEMIRQMGAGVKILGERTKPCYIKQEAPRRFRIILKQGLNRQIRRMCAEFGYKVKTLKRIRIMHITLGNLVTGKWRYLTQPEIVQLEKTLSNASN